ncbi:MAG: glycosyltransferase family 4 protein [Candidatus Altiarchaeota archaeon]
MRVGITSNVLDKQGGISRYVSELAERFSREHEIHLLSAKVNYAVRGTVIHKSRIIWHPTSLKVATSAYVNTNVGRKLKREGIVELMHGQGVEYLRPDVVTAHSCQKAAVSQMRLVRGGIYDMLKPFEPTSNIVMAIEKLNVAPDGCKRIIAVSEGVKRELMDLYGVAQERVTSIPNGVDLEEFNPSMRAEYRLPVRGRLGVREGQVLLVFTAWEFKRKGLRHIIEALPHLPDDVKLAAVGGEDPTPYRNLAERLGVKDRVIFTGHSKNVKEYYAAADAFVFPTAYEAFSLSTLEAAASGLPVIATKVNGTEELIEDGYNGHFIERDGKDIADKVKKAMGYGLERMGANARKTAEGFSWERTAEQTLKIYREALETR